MDCPESAGIQNATATAVEANSDPEQQPEQTRQQEQEDHALTFPRPSLCTGGADAEEDEALRTSLDKLPTDAERFAFLRAELDKLMDIFCTSKFSAPLARAHRRIESVCNRCCNLGRPENVDHLMRCAVDFLDMLSSCPPLEVGQVVLSHQHIFLSELREFHLVIGSCLDKADFGRRACSGALRGDDAQLWVRYQALVHFLRYQSAKEESMSRRVSFKKVLFAMRVCEFNAMKAGPQTLPTYSIVRDESDPDIFAVPTSSHGRVPRDGGSGALDYSVTSPCWNPTSPSGGTSFFGTDDDNAEDTDVLVSDGDETTDTAIQCSPRKRQRSVSPSQ